MVQALHAPKLPNPYFHSSVWHVASLVFHSRFETFTSFATNDQSFSPVQQSQWKRHERRDFKRVQHNQNAGNNRVVECRSEELLKHNFGHFRSSK